MGEEDALACVTNDGQWSDGTCHCNDNIMGDACNIRMKMSLWHIYQPVAIVIIILHMLTMVWITLILSYHIIMPYISVVSCEWPKTPNTNAATHSTPPYTRYSHVLLSHARYTIPITHHITDMFIDSGRGRMNGMLTNCAPFCLYYINSCTSWTCIVMNAMDEDGRWNKQRVHSSHVYHLVCYRHHHHQPFIHRAPYHTLTKRIFVQYLQFDEYVMCAG